MPKPTTIDFETMGIEGRPDYPPVPVGVSIKPWKKKPRYFAWGHLAGGNNCTKEDARQALVKEWRNPEGLLFQNAKFDTDVAEVHLDLPIPAWHLIHDTMYLIYLEDPRLPTFSLKPSAEYFLDMPPEEQDAVKAWILQKDHKAWIESHLGIDPKTGKPETVKPSTFGKFIAYAPGDVVGPYANGDVIRTERLFEKLWRSIMHRGMGEAYDRERRLMPHLLQSERQGLRLDVKRLRKDVQMYEGVLEGIDSLIRKKCKKPSLNVDSADELANAMVDADLADDGLMGYTKTGKLQTNKDAIRDGVTDPMMRGLLAYRGPLTTCMGTFMRPWLATAERSDGLLFTNWNQVKQGDGKNQVGTSTGRLSSTPNFQNIPKAFPELVKLLHFLTEKQPTKANVARAQAQLKKLTGQLKLPKGLPPLPLCRSYIIPYHPDHVLIDRDYSQQELRLLGHYENGPLMQSYLDDIWLDVHAKTKQLILEIVGVEYERTPVKNTNFGIIYGQGAPSLAIKNNISIDESKALYKAILEVFPGIEELQDDLKERAANDEPIRTWGGREYYCEEPKFVEKFKRVMSFDYKLLNLLIQGGAADITKEAAIRYCEAKHEDDCFLLNVHDQFTGSTPAKRLRPAMQLMTECMESIENLDVPMKTEGKWSPKNWGALQDYDKAGQIIYKGA
jgi:DNA polymerase I-like protein with 3'-5' exonuclease and polymerase domains